MPYVKQTWNQYDNKKSIEENIQNDAVVTPEKMNHIENGIEIVEQDYQKELLKFKSESSEELDEQEGRIAEIESDVVVTATNISPIKAPPLIVSESLTTSRIYEVTIKSGHMYYISLETNSTAATNTSVNLYFDAIQGIGDLPAVVGKVKSSHTAKAKANYSGLRVYPRTPAGNTLAIDYLLILNLTETFGAGNEPTKEQMDKLLSQFPDSWFDGTENLFHAKLALDSTLKNDKALNVAATNLVKNSNFIDKTNWQLSSGVAEYTILNSVAKITINADGLYGLYQNINDVGVKYLSATFKSPTQITKAYLGDINYTVSIPPDTETRLSGLSTGVGATRFYVDSFAGNHYFLSKPIVINLTTTFGAGNEPTKEQMDRLLTQFPNSWFEGTQNIFLARWTLNELRRLDNEKANKKQEDWITPTLTSGALSVPTYPVQYMKDDFGFVHFRGQLTNINTGSAVFSLPIGYRPKSSTNIRQTVQRADGANTTAIQINFVGSVYVNLPSNDLSVFLDSVSYYVG